MDKVRIKELIEVLKEHKKHIEDGYTDMGHILLGIETIEVLISLLERSDNSDYEAKPKLPSLEDVLKETNFTNGMNYVEQINEVYQVVKRLGNFA